MVALPQAYKKRPRILESSKNILLVSMQPDLSIIGLKRIHYYLLQNGYNSRLLHMPRFDPDDFRALRFEPLPASLDEVGEVAGLWTEDDGIVRLTGRFAREDSFKRYAGDHRVVHMATHAFFVPGECLSAGSMETPLRLSGLVLAGANRRDEAGPEDEDGILTSEEIASLDLSSVEWTVLSGCDTGAGDVMSGEGVLGLRRAFEIAGARTLIMSLWPVQDEATRAWMRELYTGRRDGLSTAEAVRRASLARLEASRKAGRGSHPFYWGAFVAAGDWR